MALEWRKRSSHGHLGEGLRLNLLGWLLRGLMAVGGAVLVWQGWPVAASSLQAQRADAVVTDLRKGRPLSLPQVTAGIEALDRAVAADPVAGRHLQRSELVAGGALTPGLKLSYSDQDEWLQRARADLDIGLAAAPARGTDWLRVATVRQVLDSASRAVLPPLFMSIEMAPLIPFIWPARLRIILDNWAYFSDEQREQLRAHVVTTWRRSPDRRWFGWAARDPVDELIIRFFLRNEPNAQEDLTKLILATRK